MPSLQCFRCDAKVRYADHHAGRELSCPNCKTAILIPAVDDFVLPVDPPEPPVESASQRPAHPPSPREGILLTPMPPPVSAPAGATAHAVCVALAWAAGCAAVVALPTGRPAVWLAVLALLSALACVPLALLRSRLRLATTAAALTAACALFAALALPRLAPAAPPEAPEFAPGVWVLPDAAKHPNIGAVLAACPGHIVVFATEVTVPEDAHALLDGMFGKERVTLLRRDPAQKEELLKAQMAGSLASLHRRGEVETLLVGLAEKDVRFKGHARDEPGRALEGVIRRGGIFTLSASAPSAGQKHGSLLHARGIDDLLAHADLRDQDSRGLLGGLRDAARDYASLADALAIVGNRLAFLVEVKPTPAAHDVAVGKLLGHRGKPVFVPRPPPRLFDAVDPAEGGGSGESSFELSLPRKFHWRQVGKDDRKGIDLTGGLPLARTRWKAFGRDEAVRWEVLSVRRGGRSVPVSGFDVAVELPDRVVIFRNQNHFFGATREQVERDARQYAASMKIEAPADEVVQVRKGKGGAFVGSLLYNTLANRIVESGRTEAADAEVVTAKEFARLVEVENKD